MTSTAAPASPAPAHIAEASAPDAPQADAEPLVGPAPEGTDPQPSAGLLAEACAAGRVALFRQRGTGTLRRLPYLADGSEAREVAEWFAAAREDGASVATIAGEAGVSRATVRRALAALALTEEVEAGDLDDVYAPDVVAVVVGGSDEDDQ